MRILAPEHSGVKLPVRFQGDVKLCLWFSLSDALQAPGCGTVLQDDERHREVILYLKTQTVRNKAPPTADSSTCSEVSVF